MAKNIIFILTEGEHDTAFIYRILKAHGVSTNHTILKDYPFPLNELFKNDLSSIPLEDLNIEVARSRFLPSRVMQKDENILSIYQMGGDAQRQKRIDFIKLINTFNTSDPDEIQAIKDVDISLLFFLDADNRGVDRRIEEIKDELKESFPESEIENIEKLTNKDIILVEDINIGGFIFTEAEEDEGLLEDILIPLMKLGNEDIFEKAEEFLGIHKNTNLFKNGITNEVGKDKRVNKKKYSHKKSLVGTVGQLQMSGKSNTVCISDADYLNNDKIKSNAICSDIYGFVKKVLK